MLAISTEYQPKCLYNLIGINYLQSASIFCTPTITITIYQDLPSSSINLDELNLVNYNTNQKNKINADAQALINMCEERYEFSYLRER